MAFRWKDREGAVNQAAYQFLLMKKRTEEFVANMTPAEIEENRKFFNNPEWTPKVSMDKVHIECASLVLGVGSGFRDYFCLDPENISTRQWTQFCNDILREVDRREYNRKQLDFLNEMKENADARRSSQAGL
jgi:hypothetical protein